MSARRLHINNLRGVASKLKQGSPAQEALYKAADYLEWQESLRTVADKVASIGVESYPITIQERMEQIEYRVSSLESKSQSLVDVESLVMAMLQRAGVNPRM